MELERKKEIAAELIKKAVEISETTDHDVFVDYSPHVNWIDITIHLHAWKKNTQGLQIFVIFDENHDTETELRRAMEILNSMAEN